MDTDGLEDKREEIIECRPVAFISLRYLNNSVSFSSFGFVFEIFCFISVDGTSGYV